MSAYTSLLIIALVLPVLASALDLRRRDLDECETSRINPCKTKLSSGGITAIIASCSVVILLTVFALIFCLVRSRNYQKVQSPSPPAHQGKDGLYAADDMTEYAGDPHFVRVKKKSFTPTTSSIPTTSSNSSSSRTFYATPPSPPPPQAIYGYTGGII